MKAKLENWTYKSLNFQRRIMLVKKVLQDMPLYLFFVLTSPKFILKKSDPCKEFFYGEEQKIAKSGLWLIGTPYALPRLWGEWASWILK